MTNKSIQELYQLVSMVRDPMLNTRMHTWIVNNIHELGVQYSFDNTMPDAGEQKYYAENMFRNAVRSLWDKASVEETIHTNLTYPMTIVRRRIWVLGQFND